MMSTRLGATPLRLGVLVVAAVLTVTGCGAQSRSATTSPAISLVALVRDGAQATMSRKTADMTISGSVLTAGHTLTITGTGQSDFSAHIMKAAMHMAVAGQIIAMEERVVGGHMYMSIDFAGHTLKQLTGYDWYEVPVPIGGSSSGAGLGDPTQMLALAQQRGAKVVSLGARTINGVSTTGYSVTPDRAAMIAEAKKRLKYVAPSVRATVEHVIETMKPPTVQMWFDPSDHLLRRMVTLISLSLAPGASGSGNVQFDFSHYGAPVSITAPAPSDVSTKAPGA